MGLLMSLPPLLPVEEIQKRLEVIFPPGCASFRSQVVGLAAARSVLAALYIGAVPGIEKWMAPRHTVRMDDQRAKGGTAGERLAYYKNPQPIAKRWYAENTRELRDKVWRKGLIPLNGMIEKSGVATTSQEGRYILSSHFAALFDPVLVDPPFTAAAEAWGKKYLSRAAIARAEALRVSGFASGNKLAIAFPNKETLLIRADESGAITKSVCEIFAYRFLKEPQVIWVSHSGSKVSKSFEALEKTFNLKFNAAKVLPDILLVDLAPPGREERPIFVFVEVVATDGPVDEQRKEELLKIITDQGYEPTDALFVTAFAERPHKGAVRCMRDIAWDSFVWFMNEPNSIIQFHAEDLDATLADLIL